MKHNIGVNLVRIIFSNTGSFPIKEVQRKTNQCFLHIETSQSNYFGYQLTGFYVIATFVVKGLMGLIGQNNIQPTSDQCYHFIPPENNGKPLIF